MGLGNQATEGVLLRWDGTPFATGSSQYRIGRSDTPAAGRLLIELGIEGQFTVAALDTGGHYLICDPDLANLIQSHLVDQLQAVTLFIRGERYTGDLYRLAVELRAEQGEGCRLDATVFVPQLRAGQLWSLPSFAGWTGMLEFLRFAIDPSTDRFYFGPLA